METVFDDLANFKGSPSEKTVMIFCKQNQIIYSKLTDEEKLWLLKIMDKCTLLMLCFSECCAMIEQPLILLDPAKNIMPLSVEMNSIYRLFPNVIFAASILFVSPCLLLYLFVKKPMIKTMNELTL